MLSSSLSLSRSARTRPPSDCVIPHLQTAPLDTVPFYPTIFTIPPVSHRESEPGRHDGRRAQRQRGRQVMTCSKAPHPSFPQPQDVSKHLPIPLGPIRLTSFAPMRVALRSPPLLRGEAVGRDCINITLSRQCSPEIEFSRQAWPDLFAVLGWNERFNRVNRRPQRELTARIGCNCLEFLQASVSALERGGQMDRH